MVKLFSFPKEQKSKSQNRNTTTKDTHKHICNKTPTQTLKKLGFGSCNAKDVRFLINFCTNFTAQKQLRKQKQKQKRFSRLYNLVVYIICVPKNHNFKHFHVCISINFSLVQSNVKTLSSTKHQNHHYNKQYNRTPHCLQFQTTYIHTYST